MISNGRCRNSRPRCLGSLGSRSGTQFPFGVGANCGSSETEEPQLAPTPKGNWVPDRLPRDPKQRGLLFRHLPLEIMADYWERREQALDPLNRFLREEG